MKRIEQQIIVPVYYSIENGEVQYDIEQMTEYFENAIRELN
jgi:hypothetical protein|tara:strand:- start:4 stop:126 length:123 start_codon:yes stop_codon:yes gene_type:complete